MATIRFHYLTGLMAVLFAFLSISSANAETQGINFSCAGKYSDFLGTMSLKNRQFENSPAASYTYRIRNTVTYEHVYYGKNGKVLRNTLKNAYYGTGFAYLKKEGEYYLATNQHIVEMPEITETASSVEGIPVGARKIKEVLEIVRSRKNSIKNEYIPLKMVISDESLDIAILKTRIPLNVMPYSHGDSTAIKSGDIVIAKGYPLGIFSATNTGRVTAINLVDTDGKWNHNDFATDALLNDGNSGSPVLAISCRTGELELVGIYHAEYSDGKGMGLVIGINDLRELMETFKIPQRKIREHMSLSAALDIIRAVPSPVFIPFANHVVRIDNMGDNLRFAILSDDFPLDTTEQVVIISGALDQNVKALLLPNRYGKTEIPREKLNSIAKDQIQRLNDAIWQQVGTVVEYRQLSQQAGESADARKYVSSLGAKIRRAKSEQVTMINNIDLDTIGITNGSSPERK